MAKKHDPSSLAGQLLVATPSMIDPRFEEAVVYLCEHNKDGAMGLIINKQLGSVALSELLEQMADHELKNFKNLMEIHFGGPVDNERGFVLHSTDQVFDTSIIVYNDIAVTATLDILKSIANKKGPERSLFVLGYAGWEAGQLEKEIMENSWLTVEADHDLIFDTPYREKWKTALKKIGVSPATLSGECGHA